MQRIETSRLLLSPFSAVDFGFFVREMLTDPRVTEYYYSYQGLDDIQEIHNKAATDFWDEFEESRDKYGLQIWAAYEKGAKQNMVGWCGLLHGELSDKYDGPELQYMIAGDSFGKGFATEIATAILHDAADQKIENSVFATVDIPNSGSIRVLEKLGFEFVEQIHAYGSDEMFLYRRDLAQR
jgi:ribosomal-protein-alanine N-acetyltransferase